MLCLQRQFGAPLPHSNPMPGLVSGNTYGDNNLGIDQFLQSNPLDLQTEASLSSLSELSYLETVHAPTTPPTLDTYPYTNPPTWPWDQSESPVMGVLRVSFPPKETQRKGERTPHHRTFSQHELQMMMNTSEPPSLINDGGVSFVDNNPLTVNLATISPPSVGFSDLFKDEDLTTTSASSSSCGGLSLDFDSASDGDAVSPSSFTRSPGGSGHQQQDYSFELPFSSRRHSVSVSSERTVGLKTKRNDHGDDSYFHPLPPPQPSGAAAAAAPSKRRRAAVGGDAMIVKATSAPARFTVPLPPIEFADDRSDDGSSSVISSVSSQQSQLPTPAPAVPLPRNNNRGRRRATGVRRTKCEYCPKTFTRMQDAQRHAERSCRDNPFRTGIVCPECGEVLSRKDSMQRHWRGHENPQCEPPEWACM